MSLLQLKNAQLAFGTYHLLDKAELVIQPNERLCLVGRNGCGKSTLLRVIAGEMQLDDGQRIMDASVRIARLAQDPPMQDSSKVFDFVAEGLSEAGELLKAYHQQIQTVAKDPSEQQLARLEKLQSELEHQDAWRFEQRIEQVLAQLELDAEQPLSALSGGWRRKAALARALVTEPDILLLDEPTNHLDVQTIRWLEKILLEFKGTIVFVSHDRAFIRNMATRILDLDRGNLTSYPGNYAQYLHKKAEDLQVEAAHNALFDKKLSEEETWIRQGIKARRTRNEGRVRALKALRQEHAQRRNRQGTAKVNLADGQASGKLVFEATDLSYSIAGKPLVQHLDLVVMRGDKLALIGANGSGKTTLIRLLLGHITPDAGTVRQGTNLELAYFDQHRLALNPDASVMDALADGKKEITVNGRTRHVMSYLQDYLFTPDRVNAPVHSLSGGERNRLLLAKLLIKPSNLLILDEPTNDLDVETLELLEETLEQYPGTVILVSHDREFVDNVVTSSLYFEGNGQIREFVGGYSDIARWYEQQEKAQTSSQKSKAPETIETLQSQTPKSEGQSTKSSGNKTKKLSYKLQLELEQLPAEIEALELSVEALQSEINDPEFFKQDAQYTRQSLDRLAELQHKLEKAYARWDELESMTE
ncbi:ABC transporter ATP-binding protein [Aliiglaciecola sp. CAU 1673]|uniref:ATP-binding cassette ATPase Uup n=1 Tax=Aliiglaciecola sp. CAU 1673 TaxID=3032595 RepID=UPI0023DCB287|nr:ABC transporter ATP-binding protein [Aliiglaciecola sp. CAU 1673]MDF2177522.1 ABC transporter ATP-binding protein [Aliiglaciecola sp. CAU 1673]